MCMVLEMATGQTTCLAESGHSVHHAWGGVVGGFLFRNPGSGGMGLCMGLEMAPEQTTCLAGS